MRLDEVQKWARQRFGPYSQEYGQFVAVVHSTEEFLGQLIRLTESHGEALGGELTPAYLARLRKNPQERIP